MSTSTPEPVGEQIAVRMAADHKWKTSRNYQGHLDVTAGAWGFDASGPVPVWSMQVHGPDQAEMLTKFADSISDLRPRLDYDEPGCVACVWQADGVWLKVWHFDNQVDIPEPVPAPATPSRGLPRQALSPSDRLTYTRRSTTPKETPAA